MTSSPHDRDAVEQFRREQRLDPHLIARFRTLFYKKSRTLKDAVSVLGAQPAEAALSFMRPTELELVSRADSRVDGASKLVLRTADGHLVEAVILRIKTGRTALCVSSQVGCAADCSFCATGMMGITRNLTAFEIVDQVAIANRILADEGRRVRNLVFMGMGEPFHNFDEVDSAIDLLIDSSLFNMAPGHITVSTVGLPEEMHRLAAGRPDVHIALSLHSADQEVREKLIPLARKHDLEVLHDAVRQLNRLQGRPVMIEYLMLEDVNDRDQDLDKLLAWSRDLDVHMNLIPFNPVPGAPTLRPTPKEKREAFGARLRATGLQTTLRYSLGADVTAACGQLVREEKRRR